MLLCPWDFPGKNTKCIAIFFSRASSQPREQTCISFIGWQTLDHWATREAVTVTVTAVKRETGVSGTFLKLNLKDLEYSLGTGRLSGIVRGSSWWQMTPLVPQQQELIKLHSCPLPWMPVAYLFFFFFFLASLYLSFYCCFSWQCPVSSYIFHSKSWKVRLSSLQLIAFCSRGASIPGHPIEHSQVVDVAALGSAAGWLVPSVDDW